MTAALTPDLALAYLRELSADYLGGVVLDAEGALLAGDEGLTPLARDVEGDGATTHGKVFFASDTRHAIVVVTGPRALPSPVRRDIRAALSALGSQSAQGSSSEWAPEALVNALVSAARDTFPRHSAVSRSE